MMKWGIVFAEIDRPRTSSGCSEDSALSEGVAFIISIPATEFTSHSDVVLESDVGCETGAQVTRDTKSIIVNAIKKLQWCIAFN